MLRLLPDLFSFMDNRAESIPGAGFHIGHMDSFREVVSGPKLENRWERFST